MEERAARQLPPSQQLVKGLVWLYNDAPKAHTWDVPGIGPGSCLSVSLSFSFSVCRVCLLLFFNASSAPYSARLVKASMAELSRLNTGSRSSSPETVAPPPRTIDPPSFMAVSEGDDGGGVAIGERPSIGLAGGLLGKLNACCTAACWNVGLLASGKKLVIEVVLLSDSEPIGEARSEPVDIESAGLIGSWCWSC